MSRNNTNFFEGSDSEMFTSLNERSELERFRSRMDDGDLRSFEEDYRQLWEPKFDEEMDKKFPRHPWKVLKEARAEYAEQENGGDWPSMDKRHALRVVKDEYAERWREYKNSFDPSEDT